MCQKPVLLDLCSGTKSVGSCIDQDEWTYVTVDINSDLGVPDIQCDLRTWERSGEHKVCCPQGSMDCIWFRSVLHCSTQHQQLSRLSCCVPYTVHRAPTSVPCGDMTQRLQETLRTHVRLSWLDFASYNGMCKDVPLCPGFSRIHKCVEVQHAK